MAWNPPKYPYKSITIKGLKRMFRRRDLTPAAFCEIEIEPKGDAGRYILDEVYCPDCGGRRFHRAQEGSPDAEVTFWNLDDMPPSEDRARYCYGCGRPLFVWINEIDAELDDWEEYANGGCKLSNAYGYAELSVLFESLQYGVGWGENGVRRPRFLAICGRLLGLPVGRDAVLDEPSPPRHNDAQRTT